MLITTLIITLVITAVICVFFVTLFNDFSLPELDLRKFKQPGKPLTIAVIFPHPDDETMATGGTIARYAHMPDTRVVVIDITKGDQGETGGLCQPEELADLRTQEFKQAMQALGVEESMLWTFPDGNVESVIDKVKAELRSELKLLSPDVIITYDSSGMYGHPDHIALSLALQEIVPAEFPDTKLLFTTLPAKIIKMAHMPSSITLKDRVIDLDHGSLKRTVPTYRVSFWRYAGNKMQAIKAHRSQSLTKHLPPLWLFRQTGWVEYYSEL